MIYKKLKLGVILMLGLGLFGLQAQQLDRVTLSAGGSSTDEVSYVIGEVFNFAISDGNVSFETGSQSGTGNTGSDNNYTTIENITSLNQISTYPNPATDIIYFNLKGIKIQKLSMLIFDTSGKLLQASDIKYSDIMSCNIQNLSAGNYYISISNKKGNIIGASKFIKK